MKKAVLFGATGFIGSFLLELLLSSPEYENVVVVVRKGSVKTHPKLKIVIGDFSSLPSLKDQLIADDVFISVGTTKKKVPHQNDYYKIDHDYPVLAASLAKECGAQSVFLVTAVGANSASEIFYIRTKGELERDILALNFKSTHIFRPSMLMGNRTEERSMEQIYIKIFSAINPLLFYKLNIYKGIDGRDVAKAMIVAGSKTSEKINVYHWEEMQKLARQSV